MEWRSNDRPLEWKLDMYEALVDDIIKDNRRTFTERECDILLLALVDARQKVKDMIERKEMEEKVEEMLRACSNAYREDNRCKGI